MASDNTGVLKNYFYVPIVWAAVIFAILFGILLIVHVGLEVRYRTWFMTILVIAVFLETLGYITRLVSIKSPYPTWASIISQTGVIVAPAFLAAQAYMIVGRMMAYIGGEYSYISHTKITGIFVASDVFSIMTQASGGGMLAGADGDVSQMQTAKKVLLLGLALQVVTFGIFLFVAISFDVRSSRAPERAIYHNEMHNMRKLWWAFYVSGVLITGRSIYRTVEFGSISFQEGNDNPIGYTLTHEWLMYVFDAIPICISVIGYAIFHPGRFLPNHKGRRIDGTYDTKGRRKYLCCGPRKVVKEDSSTPMEQVATV